MREVKCLGKGNRKRPRRKVSIYTCPDQKRKRWKVMNNRNKRVCTGLQDAGHPLGKIENGNKEKYTGMTNSVMINSERQPHFFCSDKYCFTAASKRQKSVVKIVGTYRAESGSH